MNLGKDTCGFDATMFKNAIARLFHGRVVFGNTAKFQGKIGFYVGRMIGGAVVVEVPGPIDILGLENRAFGLFFGLLIEQSHETKEHHIFSGDGGVVVDTAFPVFALLKGHKMFLDFMDGSFDFVEIRATRKLDGSC